MCLNSIILLAATSADTGLLSAILYWLPIVLKVALGLGFVIFVHELGHFLVAKACGVKCDKFMIGFDIGGYKLSRKWGETEYGIGILPLGGYVKMLGQDDDPSHVAEQMQKSQVDASNANGVEVTGPNGETYIVDRRSYLAKSVPQRMAIISAGVIMNIIFAFIFAVIAFGLGVPYMPSIVSESMPGSPAWVAGIQPGDEIVQIGNRVNPTFNQLRGGVMLGDHENGIPTVVRRAATGDEEALVLKPERDEGKLAKIGIVPAFSLTLADKTPTSKGSAVAKATLVSAGDSVKPSKFQGGDKIIRVNDVDVNDCRQFVAQFAQHANEPLRVTVLRSRSSRAGKAEAAANADDVAKQELTFEVPARPMGTLGLVMAIGPITAIQADSPADKAGLKVGDVIQSINGAPLDASNGWEPSSLPERFAIAAQAGEPVTLTVLRSPAATSEDNATANVDSVPVEISVTPEPPIAYHAFLPPGTPMGIPSLGVAYQIENRVVATAANGPAADSKIAPGDRVTAVKFIFPKDENGKEVDPLTVKMIADRPGWSATLIGKIFGSEGLDKQPADLPNWPFVLTQVQQFTPGMLVELTVENGDDSKIKTIKIEPSTIDDVFIAERGFVLKPIERIRKATTFTQQLQYGWDETVDSLLMVYRFLQKIGTQVPITALGGPVTIAKAAGLSAAEGFSTLLIFLTMLSANLAVINFLPIPMLDGGHMVFLAYEGLRGRPANEKVVGYMHMAGFALIVSLMLFVLALDLEFIPRNL